MGYVNNPGGGGGEGGVTDHGALTGLSDDDHSQYHNNARGDARYPSLSHIHDHIVPLAEDSFAEADPITDYPSGISIMPVTDWGQGVAATVVTERAGDVGHQTISHDGLEFSFAYRVWDSPNTVWLEWHFPLSDYPVKLSLIATDAYTEANTAPQLTVGHFVLPVSAGSNWGPNTGEAGFVIISNDGFNATETFHALNGNTYRRAYTDDAWSSWTAFSMEGHTHDNLYYTKAEIDAMLA